MEANKTNQNFAVRETVVYHHVDEQTPLVSTPSHRRNYNDPAFILKLQKIYSAITLADIFEKIVYTTITTSFLIFVIKTLGFMYSTCIILYFSFSLLSWLLAALLNLYCELIYSRKNCIVIGFILYFLATACLTALTANMDESSRMFKYILAIPLVLVCIAEGMCKTSIGQFGHEQFKTKRLSEELHSYSVRLFWIGHTCAILVIAFLLGIIEFARYDLGMGLCCVCLFAGLCSFMTAWKKFEKQTKKKQPVSLLWSIYKNAKRNKKIMSRSIPGCDNYNTPPILGAPPPKHFLDYARIKYNGLYQDNIVQEAKSFLQMAAIFFSFIPYWVCNAQGYSTFIYQALHLNTRVGSVKIPVPWMALFNIVAVLFFVQLLESLVYPKLRSFGFTFPTTWRIIFGMTFSTMSMLFAGLIQLYIYKWTNENEVNVRQIGHFNVTYAPNLHMLWTIPQFIFLGISEVLVGLTGLALACKMCPTNFQKHVISLYYAVIGIGNLLCLIIVASGDWFPHQNYFDSYGMVVYFFALAAISLFGVSLFICVISRQEYESSSVTHAKEVASESFF